LLKSLNTGKLCRSVTTSLSAPSIPPSIAGGLQAPSSQTRIEHILCDLPATVDPSGNDRTFLNSSGCFGNDRGCSMQFAPVGNGRMMIWSNGASEPCAVALGEQEVRCGSHSSSMGPQFVLECAEEHCRSCRCTPRCASDQNAAYAVRCCADTALERFRPNASAPRVEAPRGPLHFHVLKYRGSCGGAEEAVPLGVMGSARDCAAAVADTGNRVFTFGTGPNQGVCHASTRVSAECAEGWETAFANTYEVLVPVSGRKSQCDKQYVGAVVPDMAQIPTTGAPISATGAPTSAAPTSAAPSAPPSSGSPTTGAPTSGSPTSAAPSAAPTSGPTFHMYTSPDHSIHHAPGETVGPGLSGSGSTSWQGKEACVEVAITHGHKPGTTLRYVQHAGGKCYFYAGGSESGAAGPENWRYDPTPSTWNPTPLTKSPTSPTGAPTRAPTTKAPTPRPTVSPTATPTLHPTNAPTNSPTISPTATPTLHPTKAPTSPTNSPTMPPTFVSATGAPTSAAPTSAAPTSAAPTSAAPTSGSPTTGAPPSGSPTSASAEVNADASAEVNADASARRRRRKSKKRMLAL